MFVEVWAGRGRLLCWLVVRRLGLVWGWGFGVGFLGGSFLVLGCLCLRTVVSFPRSYRPCDRAGVDGGDTWVPVVIVVEDGVFFLRDGRELPLVGELGKPEVFWPGLDLFPVGPVALGTAVSVGSCNLVVDDLGDGVRLRLPRSLCRGGLYSSAVHPVADL